MSAADGPSLSRHQAAVSTPGNSVVQVRRRTTTMQPPGDLLIPTGHSKSTPSAAAAGVTTAEKKSTAAHSQSTSTAHIRRQDLDGKVLNDFI